MARKIQMKDKIRIWSQNYNTHTVLELTQDKQMVVSKSPYVSSTKKYYLVAKEAVDEVIKAYAEGRAVVRRHIAYGDDMMTRLDTPLEVYTLKEDEAMPLDYEYLSGAKTKNVFVGISKKDHKDILATELTPTQLSFHEDYFWTHVVASY